MQTQILSVSYLPAAVVSDLARHRQIAELATQALVAEAELTPKPGLVDRRGSGAHTDLSLELLCRSAVTLKPYFSAMAGCAAGRRIEPALRHELAKIGRDAEQAMYEVTAGSNAHKGAIWILGLLVGAAATEAGRNATEIAATAGAIARLPDRSRPITQTHGEMAKIRYGVNGARGEACSNFPHIMRFGLPTLRRRRASGLFEQVSRLDALFSIMTHLDDTCVLHRGGIAALQVVQSRARAVLAAGGSGNECGRNQMRIFDEALIAMRVSPGGSADLLAATIFLDAIEREQGHVCADQSEWFDENDVSKLQNDKLEVMHGAA
jgi:triphosphoribosyl-dephospho-CoA synthase